MEAVAFIAETSGKGAGTPVLRGEHAQTELLKLSWRASRALAHVGQKGCSRDMSMGTGRWSRRSF